MPASRIVINSPTTHGAIGFSTDLPPSMTLGCGSWGGNVTSDNVSPIHLMDIKRVAFETKPVKKTMDNAQRTMDSVPQPSAAGRQAVKREQIAAIVDKFLSEKFAEFPESNEVTALTNGLIKQNAEVSNDSEILPPDSPVKTIIHELRPQSLTENGVRHEPVDFVSETDVRAAVEKGEKIYITAKTILTPSARDLGEEKEIFARV